MTTPDPPGESYLLTRLQAQLQTLYAREQAAGPAIVYPPLPPASAATTTWRERLLDEPQRRRRALAQNSGGKAPLDDEAWQRRGRGRAFRPASMTGETIRQARALAGLSQRQLARDRHISRGWLADIERGRRAVPPELAVWATLVQRRPGRLQPKEPKEDTR